jgi:hypothetical protein
VEIGAHDVGRREAASCRTVPVGWRSTASAARSAVPVAPGFVVAIIQITLLRPELARSHTEGFLASLPKLFPSAIETPLLCVCLLLQYQLQSCSREGEGDIGAHVL